MGAKELFRVCGPRKRILFNSWHFRKSAARILRESSMKEMINLQNASYFWFHPRLRTQIGGVTACSYLALFGSINRYQPTWLRLDSTNLDRWVEECRMYSFYPSDTTKHVYIYINVHLYKCLVGIGNQRISSHAGPIQQCSADSHGARRGTLWKFTKPLCYKTLMGLISWLFMVYMVYIYIYIHQKPMGCGPKEITTHGFLFGDMKNLWVFPMGTPWDWQMDCRPACIGGRSAIINPCSLFLL